VESTFVLFHDCPLGPHWSLTDEVQSGHDTGGGVGSEIDSCGDGSRSVGGIWSNNSDGSGVRSSSGANGESG
jgi:hypothetical protein